MLATSRYVHVSASHVLLLYNVYLQAPPTDWLALDSCYLAASKLRVAVCDYGLQNCGMHVAVAILSVQ